jgi:CcmD family protein
MKNLTNLVAFFLMSTLTVLGQTVNNSQFMESQGKFYVVIGVVLIIFLGIVLFLLRTEKRLNKLEKEINDDI